jgi:hypothetical protein
MKYTGIPYKAFGDKGEYIRDARTIHELSVCDRVTAINDATRNIEKMLGIPRVRSIAFGLPVYESYGMRQADAKKHKLSKLLMTCGCDVPLNLCN